mmetsp:Transcript_15753/g.34428  ORF Transcript_15753/g.34428 Transcript_15753/m.34428 type:complete len:322 (-) Transcript_15753:140-1105(-)
MGDDHQDGGNAEPDHKSSALSEPEDMQTPPIRSDWPEVAHDDRDRPDCQRASDEFACESVDADGDHHCDVVHDHADDEEDHHDEVKDLPDTDRVYKEETIEDLEGREGVLDPFLLHVIPQVDGTCTEEPHNEDGPGGEGGHHAGSRSSADEEADAEAVGINSAGPICQYSLGTATAVEHTIVGVPVLLASNVSVVAAASASDLCGISEAELLGLTQSIVEKPRPEGQTVEEEASQDCERKNDHCQDWILLEVCLVTPGDEAFPTSLPPHGGFFCSRFRSLFCAFFVFSGVHWGRRLGRRRGQGRDLGLGSLLCRCRGDSCY